MKLLKKNKHFVFWALLASLLFVLLNMVLVFLGFYSWSGKFTGIGVNKYNVGSDYQLLAEQSEKQKKMGWKGYLSYPGETVVEFRIEDENATLISDKSVTLTAKHSSDPTMDTEVEMIQSGQVYRVDLLHKGLWYLNVSVKENGMLLFLLQDEVVLGSEF